MNVLYLCLLALAAVVFVHQRRQLRHAAEERERLVADHGRELEGIKVELEVTREELSAKRAPTGVSPAMLELIGSVGVELDRAIAVLSFEDPVGRARLEVYRRPHIPAVVATPGSAARFQAGIAALVELDSHPQFQLRVRKAAGTAAALVDAVRYARPHP